MFYLCIAISVVAHTRKPSDPEGSSRLAKASLWMSISGIIVCVIVIAIALGICLSNNAAAASAYSYTYQAFRSSSLLRWPSLGLLQSKYSLLLLQH